MRASRHQFNRDERFDEVLSIDEVAAIQGIAAIDEVAASQGVAAIDEVAAIQGVAAIETVTSIEEISINEVAAIQGVASIQTVATIEEKPSIRCVVPVINTPTNEINVPNYCCLYDVATADVNFEFIINGQTVVVPANKCLLAHQSPVFRQMFFGDMKDEVRIITQVKIVDATPEEFIEFARCFYYKPTIITAMNASALTYLTHKYDVEYFEKRCMEFLAQMVRLNVVSICWVLPLVTLLNYNNLRHRCLDLIRLNGRILIECLEFKNCSLETLNSVLKIPFNGRNEARVFEKCVSWAKESCEQKNLEPTTRENIRNQLGDCFDLIRFDRMSPSQFVQCLSKHSYIFHPDEIGNIAQTVKGQEQEFAKVEVPPVTRVEVMNQIFKPFELDVDTADVFFTFQNAPGEEEKRIAAHKCILSAYSSVFKSELMALDKSNTVRITDASFDEYTAFIKILCGRCRLLKYHKHLSNENIDKILMLVKKYNVHCGFTLDHIEDELMSIQNDENLFWLFELSRIHSLHFLHCLCINRIASGRESGIFSSESFLNLCQESFKIVFSHVINKCDASTVCDAGMKWAEAFCAQNQLTISGENIRMALGDIWPMMPFAALEPNEFIRYRHNLGDIFSSEQIKMIIDKMADEYETESDTNIDELDATASDEENTNDSLSDCSVPMIESESDDESSLEDDNLSESERASVDHLEN